MPEVKVTLQNGAYFAYDNEYEPEHPKSWEVTTSHLLEEKPMLK